VDVVEEVSHRFDGEDVRFIHVEVYEDNDPAKGFNQWMQEWKLPTAPIGCVPSTEPDAV